MQLTNNANGHAIISNIFAWTVIRTRFYASQEKNFDNKDSSAQPTSYQGDTKWCVFLLNEFRHSLKRISIFIGKPKLCVNAAVCESICDTKTTNMALET